MIHDKFRHVVVLLALASLFSFAPAHGQGEQQGSDGMTLLLPTVPGAAQPSQPLPRDNEEVFGLLGTLEAAIGQPFSTYLIVSDGQRVGLAGETPEVEARIVILRDQQSGNQVKVWGTFYAQNPTGGEPSIAVSDIIPAEQTAPGAGLPVAVVQFDVVNLRRGPGNRFPRGEQATDGQICVIVNRNSVESWYFVDCSGGVTGWIDKRLVEVRGNTSNVQISEHQVQEQPQPTPLPTATPLPAPTPVPPPSTYWNGQFYANPQLMPPAIFSLNSTALDFNWGAGSPDVSVPADGFSARFERTFDFSYGYYRFEARADDGVRVYLDDQLIIDEWHGAVDGRYVVGRTLNGRHLLRVEYYEATGDASVRVQIDYLGDNLVWKADYYRGVEPRGAPVLEQRESRGGSPIDYNWGASSPVPGLLASDAWSARWEGTFNFENGNYVFRANSDDGVRVYLNDTIVIDGWDDGYREIRNRFVGVGEDEHTVLVEFYDRTGSAMLQLWWFKEANAQIPE